MEEVRLLGGWASPFSRRVEIVLKLKGVEYEFIQQDVVQNKSEELLKYNPIHKKIPVLIHHGKPLAESIVIMEYIDETWKGDCNKPLLPKDPFERAQARFWTSFIDDKLTPALRNALMEQGEVSEKGMEDSYELLQVLENSINEIKGKKKFFGGDSVGFLDIAAITILSAAQAVQEAVKKELFMKQEFPRIYTWIDDVFECSVVRENMPQREKQVTFYRDFLEAKFANVPK